MTAKFKQQEVETDPFLAAHAALTQGVHGIPDTSALATQTDVTADVAAHAALTKGAHGIADTANLATQTDVATHSALTKGIHGIPDTSALATSADVTAAIDAVVAGAPGALDTLKEIADTLKAAEESEKASLEALTALVNGKASKAANLGDLVDPVAARGNLGLGSAAIHPAGDFDAVGAAAAAQAASQPLDGDLTSIAALATNPFGRELLTKATALAVREYLDAQQSLVGLMGNEPTARIEVVPRIAAQSARSYTTKRPLFSFFTPDRTLKVKKLKTCVFGTLEAESTFTKMGLYTVAESGALTCVARTENKAGLFNALGIREATIVDDGAVEPKAITEYELQRGVRYAFCIMSIATTMPQLQGLNFSQNAVPFLSPIMCAQANENQTDLPASLAPGKLTAAASMMWGYAE
jgi:hypothetical protein